LLISYLAECFAIDYITNIELLCTVIGRNDLREVILVMREVIRDSKITVLGENIV